MDDDAPALDAAAAARQIVAPVLHGGEADSDIGAEVTPYIPYSYGAEAKGKRRMSRGKKVALALGIVAFLAAIGACIAFAVLPYLERQEALESYAAQDEQRAAEREQERADAKAAQEQARDEQARKEQEAAAEAARLAATTPYIANYGDVMVHSPLAVRLLTCVLFHQAATAYGLPMDTQLPEADLDAAYANHDTRINRDQADTAGQWLDAEALHVYRTGVSTPMNTSVDVGGAAGSQVVAPVTGTVVLLRDYMLYDETPDIEIHIQPDGHPELDVVVIHITDPVVAAGDHVEGGLTPICSSRDIDAVLTGIQLDEFTPENVNGNHVHVQVNDANFENYREKRLEGAITVE